MTIPVKFYHVCDNNTYLIISQLLLKTLDLGKKSLILSDDIDNINNVLWQHDLFIPHCLENDELQEYSPIILNNQHHDLNIDSYDFLFIINNYDIDGLEITKFERIYTVFHQDIADLMRPYWKQFAANENLQCEYYNNKNSKWQKII